MFTYQPNKRERTCCFIATFHSGIPFVLARTGSAKGWVETSQELANRFSRQLFFQVLPVQNDQVTHFPLGDPLVLRYSSLYAVFDLPHFLQQAGISLPPTYRLDHEIWICPLGTILIIGTLTLDSESQISFAEFENVVDDHYAELASVYAAVADVLIATLPSDFLSSSLCCSNDIQKAKHSITLAVRYGFFTDPSSRSLDAWRQNEVDWMALEDNLIDVYYIDFEFVEKPEHFDIQYENASIQAGDAFYLQIVSIAYSLFAGLLWIQRHLVEQTKVLEQALVGSLVVGDAMSVDLKSFRILCLRFINEASPISIRLTHYYMKRIEEFWQNSRLHLLVEQINGQLETLEKMLDWVEELKREERNIKVGIAAIILALLSITAVVAQLISTIDVNSFLGMRERIAFVLLGFLIGLISTLVIFMFPAVKWRARFQRRGRWFKGQ